MEMKDIVQVIAWIAGIVGGLIAATRAIVEMRRRREELQREFRWRQAKEAIQLIDDMWNHRYAEKGLLMLGWENIGRNFKTDNEEEIYINMPVILDSLDTNLSSRESVSESLIYVRTCMEYIFEYLGKFQYYIEVDLVKFEDIRHHIRWYIEVMGKHRDVFGRFMKKFDYRGCLEFVQRFEEWRFAPASQVS